MTAFPMILSHSNANPRKATVATPLSNPFKRFLGRFRGSTPTGPLLSIRPLGDGSYSRSVTSSGEGGEAFDIAGGDRHATRKPMYHSCVKVTDNKMALVDKPTAPGNGQGGPTSQIYLSGKFSRVGKVRSVD
jgi:hypothetical protein